MAIVGRFLEPRGSASASLPSRTGEHGRLRSAGPAGPVLRRHRRQHGLDGQPLHVGPQDPPRRRLHAARRGRQAARPQRDRLQRSGCGKRSRTCRWSSAASRPACAASPTTITGRRRCAARSCWTRAPTCCSTATPSAPWPKSRTASPGGEAIEHITDVRGTAFLRNRVPDGCVEIDSTHLDTPGRLIRRWTPTRWNRARPPRRKRPRTGCRWCDSCAR
jgi:hypothetical protein